MHRDVSVDLTVFRSGYAKEIGIDCERPHSARRTSMAGKSKQINDVLRSAHSTSGCFHLLVDHGLLAAFEAKVRRFVSDAKLPLRIGMIRVLFFTFRIEVVGIAVIPGFDGVGAVLTYKTNTGGHVY